MKLQKPLLRTLIAVVVASSGACGGNPLVVGGNPAGSPAGGGGTSGIAGAAGSPTGSAGGGATGSAGNSGTGSGGSAAGGTAGAVTPQAKPLKISPVEAVNRISRVLWNDVPDADLLAQAARARFTSTSDLAGTVRQMLADPRAAQGVGAFYRWWLGLDGVSAIEKDATSFPTFTPALAKDMARETETFAVTITLDQSGSYNDLMKSPSTFLDARLAEIYGVPGITGDALQYTPVDAYQRAGLFTQPAILVQGTNLTANDPSMRGGFIDTKFLCMPIPVAPAGENSFPTPPAGMTVRRALSASVGASASCQACHSLLDPAGYALENFDAIGRWRTTDNGGVVDTSGLDVRDLLDGQPQPVDGPISLSAALTDAPKAQQCMVRQWYAFVLNQRPSNVDDALVRETYPIFRGASLNLQALIVAVLTSDPFLAPQLGIE